jgi:hypothetical protein
MSPNRAQAAGPVPGRRPAGASCNPSGFLTPPPPPAAGGEAAGGGVRLNSYHGFFT